MQHYFLKIQNTLKNKETSENSRFRTDSFIDSSDVIEFLAIVRKYEHIETLTPEIIHELIEKIIVHEADKSSGKHTQQIDIYFHCDVAISSVTTETGKFGRKTA